MKITKVEINKLVENIKNTRIHGEIQINEFVKSIKKFGVIRPIIVDENYVILCGHGLYKALQKLGYTDVDVVVKNGLTEKEKNKLMLADNKIYNLGIDDYDAIDKLIVELDGDFDIPGYREEDMQMLYGAVKDIEQSFVVPKIEPKRVVAGKSNNYELNSNVLDADGGQEPTNAVRYIICPHCNQRIDIE